MNPNDELFVLKTKQVRVSCLQPSKRQISSVSFLPPNRLFPQLFTHTHKTVSDDQSFPNLIQSL